MLKSLFKPKWQHPDQSVRQKALSNLDCEQDLELIEKMAINDPSSSLREQALSKLTNIESLSSFLNSVETADDWYRVALRINQLSPQIDNLVNSFNKVGVSWSSEAKLQVIGKCKNIELANALVFSINDVDAFFNLAISAKSIEIKLKAVEKIDDIERLHQLSKKATNKQVIKAVKVKLNIAKDKQQKKDVTIEQAERLLNSIKKLSQQSWFDAQYESKLNNIVSHWQELDLLIVDNSSELKIAFQSSLTDCRKIISIHQQQFEQEALEQDAVNKQNGLCTELEKLISEMNSSSMQSIDLFQSVKGALKILDDNWSQAVEVIAPKVEIKTQFENLRKQLCASFIHWQNLIALQPEIEAHFENVPENNYQPLRHWLEKWQQFESKLNWPNPAAQPTVLNHWNSLSTDYQNSYNMLVASQKKKAQYINQKIHLLEKHCKQKNLIAANKLINYIEVKSEGLISDFLLSYQKKMEHLSPQLEELRDWHSFATKPKKESLCLEMEQLQFDECEPLEKARQVRDLQNQWRELAASNSTADEQLWERFKQASDKAYLPCLEYYEQQDKIKSGNLSQQVKICEQLEELNITTSDEASTVDWKTLENTLNKAAKNWKQYQAVPENERLSINKRYQDITSNIRNELKNEKQRNLDLRCELIGKAENLVELDDTKLAVSQAINLQKQWKEIGLTFFKADREKWQLFRSTLDKIFEKRDSLKKAFKAELHSNQEHLEDITKKIILLCEMDDAHLKSSFDDFSQLKQSWSNDIELPKASANKALASFNNACTQYQEHFSGLTGRLQAARTKSIFQAMRSLESIEERLLEGASEIPEEVLSELEKSTNLLLDNQSIKTVLENRITQLSQPKQYEVNHKGIAQLQALALETEILLGIDSPEAFKSQRMEIQLQQLQNGIGQSSVAIDRQKAVWDMFNRWLSVGFIDKDNRQQLEDRRNNAFSAAGV
jgi:DNA repair protein SbcC/Rad50